MSTDTIAARATPPGKGGIGIIRVSGPHVPTVAHAILNCLPKPRCAEHLPFKDEKGQVIDVGLAIYFPAPHSFTGEVIIEFQGHGGPIVLDSLLKVILQHDVRLAKPGEFSERAFLNDKLDLPQAEAVADLIDSASLQAARSAMRSLQGAFSTEVQKLAESIMQIRKFVEAAIDFPEEEVDFLNNTSLTNDLEKILDELTDIHHCAAQGVILRDGMTIVIAGYPNVGKSTLLNCLSGRESAIVADTPGTTRDVMREHIVIDGMPLHVIDTAGLRDSQEHVEQEGVRRAWNEIKKADRVFLVIDVQEISRVDDFIRDIKSRLPEALPITIICNKIDLINESPKINQKKDHDMITLSAKTQEGLPLLKEYIKKAVGYHDCNEGTFIARQRHVDALKRAERAIAEGSRQFKEHRAAELLAEDLRQAQYALDEITGKVTTDDLLESIFTTFCIGK